MLIGPITPTCDQYIQYLLAGTNSLVHNQHRQGLQPWWCRLSTSLSPPFPTDGPSLSPNGPVRSLVDMLHKRLPISIGIEIYCRHVVFRPLTILPLPTSTPSRCYRLVSSSRNNKDNQEVNLMHLGYQFNSYNLTHNQELY
jgi:hypothetical protein